ncbi:MAG: GNAT family N-acetyltransferase [Solirubrobacterales bacterium]|nr:GNAT family N-acetyltransferase [Solirubrobacterales bacterium]
MRRAGAADLPAVADTLAAAFDGEPWTRHVVDARDHRARLRDLYAFYAELSLDLGELWISEDAAAVAAWLPSARFPDVAARLAEEAPRLRALAGGRVVAWEAAERIANAHALEEPHWFLASVGVRPERQGQGLGTAVLAPVLDVLDVPAALETSTPGNVGFYARLGFAVRAEAAVPGGPRVWFLVRRP